MEEDLSKIIGAANNNAQMNMKMPDLTQYPVYKCDKCGCVTFQPVMAMRRVPGVAFGRADLGAQLYPEQVLICTKCGELFKKDRAYLGLEKDEEETKEDKPKSNLIIT